MVRGLDTGDSIGTLTETAPATDTASSGLNGRLQRVAQRLTTLIGTTLSGVGHTAAPSAVSDGTAIPLIADKVGKLIAVGSIRDLKGEASITITSSTAETTLIAAVASTFLDLYGLILSNTSATATEVTIRDATGAGTARSFMVPAGDMRGFMLSEGAALKQATVNNNWTAQCTTSVASLKIDALYVKNI